MGGRRLRESLRQAKVKVNRQFCRAQQEMERVRTGFHQPGIPILSKKRNLFDGVRHRPS
ncbi:hypothetical protein [Azospirillum palustre]